MCTYVHVNNGFGIEYGTANRNFDNTHVYIMMPICMHECNYY